MRTAAILTICILSTSCMHALRGPAEDHAIQANAIAEKCRSGYPEAPCSKELQEDIEAMAKQADCIAAVTTGETCE